MFPYCSPLFLRSGPNRGCAGQDTSGRYREVVDEVATKLVNAGWSYISGQNTGDVLLESAATPSAANEIHVRIRDSRAAKTTLARRLLGILPQLDFPEALETTQVHSVAGTLGPNAGLMHECPFGASHHTVSDAGLLGGGIGIPRLGEVSLAHNSVQFLDEPPEFPRNVLEFLRQPARGRQGDARPLAVDADLPRAPRADSYSEPVIMRIAEPAAAR